MALPPNKRQTGTKILSLPLWKWRRAACCLGLGGCAFPCHTLLSSRPSGWSGTHTSHSSWQISVAVDVSYKRSNFWSVHRVSVSACVKQEFTALLGWQALRDQTPEKAWGTACNTGCNLMHEKCHSSMNCLFRATTLCLSSPAATYHCLRAVLGLDFLLCLDLPSATEYRASCNLRLTPKGYGVVIAPNQLLPHLLP